MEAIRPTLEAVIGKKCVQIFMDNHDFYNQACLKITLSKLLGAGIITGSMLVKVPQILKIFGNRSAAGITLISVMLELFAITSNMSYSYVTGFPFSAWGEGCFLAVQTAIVALLVVHYNFNNMLYTMSLLFGYASCVYALMFGLTPPDTLWSMQALNIPIIVVSKSIQAFANFKNKSTGQISAVTSALLFAGALARIFTSIQETGDQMLVLTFCSSAFVNGMIFFQVLWYWESTSSGQKSASHGSAKSGKSKKKKQKHR